MSAAASQEWPLRRREFVLLACGASLTWPRRAAAAPVVGILESARVEPMALAALRRGLAMEGFVEGRTAALVYRAAQGDYGQLAALAGGLVGRPVSLIVALGSSAAIAAKAATGTIPIVFAIAPDPIELGLLGSLDRPGGNVAGAAEMAAGRERKRLDLLRELIPAARKLSLLVNPANPDAVHQIARANSAAAALKLELQTLHATDEGDFEAAFANAAQAHSTGLVIADDAMFASQSERLAALALDHAMPAIFAGRTFTESGGLMSYGGAGVETYHQAGTYAGLILKGANPADLPVYRALKTETTVNAATARRLGLTIPEAVLTEAAVVVR